MAGVPKRLSKGRYRVMEIIGEGADALVYRAWDMERDKICAVKLHTPFDSEIKRARFLEESRVLARIEHKHIVRIHDAGEEDGWMWFAMKLARGGTLRELVPLGGLELDHAIRLILQTLLALAVIHRANLVHRDVKPHNVFLDRKGRAVLGDFGAVKQEAAPFQTQDGATLGTPGYRAPEQDKAAEQANERADIYGAGATLYYAVTGQHPEYLHGATRFYPQVLEPLDDRIQPIVLRATQYEPAERYASAAEMGMALARLLDEILAEKGEPSELAAWKVRFDNTREGLLERAARWFERLTA